MLQCFVDYISRQHLLPSGGKVLLAVSGGRDSVCMAHLFHRAAIPFAIAHCNFHLRPDDCDRDQQFVARLAESVGVTFHTTDFDTRAVAVATGESIEEAARRLRYSYFASLLPAGPYCAVATAHHRDDAVETFFLNLFRGTGISGLHGIRPLSHMADPALTLVRPLLCFSRADIDAYVREHSLRYVDDHTNALLDARRNRIRLQLMPLLRQLYPSVDATMAANIERLYDTEILYRERLDQLRSALLKPYRSRVADLPFAILAVDLDGLAAHPAPTTVLFELMHPYGFNAAVVADIVRVLEASERPSGQLFYSPTHAAELHRGRLLLAPRVDPAAGRHPQPGDRIRTPRGTRLVSDHLKDLRLSRLERPHVLLQLGPDGLVQHLLNVGL